MNYTIDSSHSEVGFSVRHLGIHNVKGRFGAFTGSLELDERDPAAAHGRVEVQVASIDTRDERRDQHLRSADFFDAETYPTMVFETRSITPRGGDAYLVAGDLTIRGVTKPVELEATFTGVIDDPFGSRRAGVSISGSIDRTQWGLTWNTALDAGRLLLGETVNISADAEVVEQTAAQSAVA